jgi:cardiolipin synthase
LTLHVTRAGVVGFLVFAVLALLWEVTTWPSPWYVFWFAPLLFVGGLLPGPANQVTLARAYLAAPAFHYARDPHGLGLLAVTVALAGVTDLADGTVARRFGGGTAVGGALDPVVDGIFFGAVGLGLWIGAAYPGWLALVVAARYALPVLAGAALLATGRRPELRHTFFGQLSTTLIAVLLGGVALLRGLGQDPAPVVRAGELVIPAATLLTFANLAWEARPKG